MMYTKMVLPVHQVVGKFVRRARSRAGIGPAEIERQMGWDSGMLDQIERGETPLLLADAAQLCLLMGASLADLEGELLLSWQNRQAPRSEGINSTTDTPRT
jgi:transcriptional regulator with XRE-family HTH domain